MSEDTVSAEDTAEPDNPETEPGDKKRVKFFNDPKAPVLHVDELSGLSISNEVTKLNLVAEFPGHRGNESDEQHVVVGRLVIPNIQFAKFVTALNRLHEMGYQDGIYPKFDPEADKFLYKKRGDDAEE